MRKIVSTFVKYPIYANLVLFMIIAAGLISFFSMKKSFFPERSSRDIIVTIAYPGASPKEMEEGLTVRIEEAVRGIVGLKEINSTSSENLSTVRITTTGEYDLDETLMEVKNAVDGINSFPIDAEKPIVFKQRSQTPAMWIGLSGNVDLLTLKQYANKIENDFLSSGVVSQLQVHGLPALEISVEVTEENLLRYGLTFDEISRAIALNNRDISAGMIRSQDEEILIRSRSRSVSPNVISDIILRANPDGSVIRIRDVASVKKKFADVANHNLMNGKQAVYFLVQKLAEEDLQEISEYCKNYIKEFNDKNLGVKMDITFDFLTMLKSRLHLLYSNGSIGLILVIIALGLFLSTRLSLWVAAGIPVSFLAMFVVAVFAGITVNMISLFGMILVVGILVDDGIVIAENIYTHFEKGKSPKRAAVDGTMEVLPAVITSVATTIIAFSPLMMLEGMMEFLYEMAFVVIFSLSFSLLEAFLVLPMHIGSPHILRSRKRGERGAHIRDFLEKIVNIMRYKIYGWALKRILEWRWVAIFVPLALLIITVGLFMGGFIQQTFFPVIPFDSFKVDIAFKPGAGEKQTLQYLDRFDKAVWEVNDQLKKKYDDPNDFIKYTFFALGSAFNGEENGSHSGNINVMLRDMEGAPVSSFEIANMVKKQIGEVNEAEKFSVGGQNRFGKPVSISLLGNDLHELANAKTMLTEKLRELPTLTNITDNNAVGMQEVRLKLKPKAYFLGLGQAEITNQVRQGFFGGQAQRLQAGRDELRVWVRYPKKDRLNLGQLEDMKIKASSGEYPLTELATYSIERGPVSIRHFNISREVRVETDLTDPYSPVPPILNQIRSTVLPQIKAKYPGVRVFFQGQQRDSDEATHDILKYFGTAFAMIVLLLMIHFRSVLHPIIILLMIPLSLIGAAWGHGIQGIPVSILSFWGMVALSGIIINDAVVFLAKYNTNLSEGMKVKEPVFDTGTGRFRAIMLTSLTTVVGLYPIVLEGSFQAQFLKPMAITLAYGVMFGTFFILVFFPALILALNDIKVLAQWWWTGEKPDRESVEVVIRHSKAVLD